MLLSILFDIDPSFLNPLSAVFMSGVTMLCNCLILRVGDTLYLLDETLLLLFLLALLLLLLLLVLLLLLILLLNLLSRLSTDCINGCDIIELMCSALSTS